MSEKPLSRVPVKIDRTKRFNTPDYKRKVNAARRYKRERPKVQENPERAANLKRWLFSLAVLIGIAGIVYLFYFAKFLQVNNLILTGANSDLSPQIESQFQNFIRSYRYGLPQKNIFLFSSKAFTAELRKDGLVEPSISIKKQYWHSIKVGVTQRTPEFLMTDANSRLLLSSDGYVTNILQPSDTPPQGLSLITDDSVNDPNNQPSPATPGLNKAQMEFIVFMQNNLNTILQIQATSYEISSRESEYLVIHTAPGVNLMFDMAMDPKVALGRLETVLQQPGQQNRSAIAYIDLRFDPKVYVCMIGQPCAVAPPPMPPVAPITTNPVIPDSTQAAPNTSTNTSSSQSIVNQ